MTAALLALLNLQVMGVLVYAAHEWRSAKHYRDQHLEIREDELTMSDALAQIAMGRARGSRVAVVAGQRAESQHGDESDAADDVTHDSSFLKVGV